MHEEAMPTSSEVPMSRAGHWDHRPMAAEVAEAAACRACTCLRAELQCRLAARVELVADGQARRLGRLGARTNCACRARSCSLRDAAPSLSWPVQWPTQQAGSCTAFAS